MRHWKLWVRDLVTTILVLLPVVILALLMLVTTTPRHPWALAARDWPLIGEWVAGLDRESIELRFDDGSGASAESEDVIKMIGVSVWLDAGTGLHRLPAGEVVEVLPVATRLEVVERRGDWVQAVGRYSGWVLLAAGAPALNDPDPSQRRRVFVVVDQPLFMEPGGLEFARTSTAGNLAVDQTADQDWVRVIYGDLKLWLRAPQFTGGKPPLGSAPEPVRGLEAVEISAERMIRARSAFQAPEVAAAAGPYRLIGDSPRIRSLAALCSGRLADLDHDFATLTGVKPRWQPRETLLAFSTHDSYRSFLGDDRLPARDPAGVALPFQGFAATFFGQEPGARVCEMLVHEAAHLTARRAFGPLLPPWLSEGIAAVLEHKFDSAHPNPPPDMSQVEVLSMDNQFYNGNLAARYQLAAAWVDLLLTDSRYAAASKDFLQERAEGKPLDPTADVEVAYLATPDRFWAAWQLRLAVTDEQLVAALASRTG